MAMKGRRPLAWVVMLVGVVLVEAVATVGWWAWLGAERALRFDPSSGAARVAGSPILSLPSVVRWSRRLQIGDLAGASVEVAAAALARIGRLQRGWVPTDADGFRNSGRAALLAGNLDGGRTDLEQALLRDPTSPYLHRILALLLRQSGRPREFLEHMAAAQGIAPDFVSPPVELTPEDAAWIRREGLKRRVDLYPRQRVQALLALAEQLRRDQGEETARAVLGEVAGEPEVELTVAEWDLTAGRAATAAERAERVATRGVLTAKLRVRAWSLLAQARDQNGDVDGATAAAGEALQLGPTSPAPYLALASLSERRRDWAGALAHMRRAWGIAPADLGVVLRFAAAAERAGSTGDARLALQRAAELAPDRADVAALLVEHYLRAGDYMAATIALSRALERFPTDGRLVGLADRLRREVGRVNRR